MHEVKALYIITVFSLLLVLAGGTLHSYRLCEHTWSFENIPVIVEGNQNGTDDCIGLSEYRSCRRAGRSWNRVSNCSFRFAPGGATSRWPKTFDGHNVIGWQPGTDYVAITYIWGCGERIIEADISFNSHYSWSSSGEEGKMDIQNAATHEFGHFLCLNDLYGWNDREKTMYGYTCAGESKKCVLHPEDENSARYMYSND
jgi:hypothetical protein